MSFFSSRHVYPGLSRVSQVLYDYGHAIWPTGNAVPWRAPVAILAYGFKRCFFGRGERGKICMQVVKKVSFPSFCLRATPYITSQTVSQLHPIPFPRFLSYAPIVHCDPVFHFVSGAKLTLLSGPNFPPFWGSMKSKVIRLRAELLTFLSRRLPPPPLNPPNWRRGEGLRSPRAEHTNSKPLQGAT